MVWALAEVDEEGAEEEVMEVDLGPPGVVVVVDILTTMTDHDIPKRHHHMEAAEVDMVVVVAVVMEEVEEVTEAVVVDTEVVAMVDQEGMAAEDTEAVEIRTPHRRKLPMAVEDTAVVPVPMGVELARTAVVVTEVGLAAMLAMLMVLSLDRRVILPLRLSLGVVATVVEVVMEALAVEEGTAGDVVATVVAGIRSTY